MVSKSLVMLGLLAPASAFVSRAPIVRTATVGRSKHVVKVRVWSVVPSKQRRSNGFRHDPFLLPFSPPYRRPRRPSCSLARAPSTWAWRPRCVWIPFGSID